MPDELHTSSSNDDEPSTERRRFGIVHYFIASIALIGVVAEVCTITQTELTQGIVWADVRHVIGCGAVFAVLAQLASFHRWQRDGYPPSGRRRLLFFPVFRGMAAAVMATAAFNHWPTSSDFCSRRGCAVRNYLIVVASFLSTILTRVVSLIALLLQKSAMPPDAVASPVQPHQGCGVSFCGYALCVP